ncbi:hypothetical protein GCM10011390_11150 [Aureimonas endophytica]|uniref:Uncharacterized protein n=1 Tax=Aureimonas endophytica TaxID=2027858 RepID=A0A916ZFC1_9HYPH|nr:hypothetical protein [Aureimonas endophytica]GGD94190.1 hypothetical protein GCM10011390_11150 [Aureimonas endophytica]
MIATALTFLLGFLLALLLALLFAPVLWRKSRSFARREFEATMPASANEIRAEFDFVRAEAALKVRQAEIGIAEMRDRMARALAELGSARTEIADRSRTLRELQAEMAGYVAERDKLRQTFFALEGQERDLAAGLDEARRDGALQAEELEALALRFRETSDLAEERKVELVAAETRIERLEDSLRALERASLEKDTLIRLLRHEAEKGTAPGKPHGGPLKAGAIPGLAGRTPVSTPSPPPRAEDPLGDALARPRPEIGLGPAAAGMDPGERLAEIAAHAIVATARREGPSSPLAPLLAPGSEASSVPDLAARARRLAAASDREAPVQAEVPVRRAE